MADLHDGKERRRFTRVPFTARVCLEGFGASCTVELVDISLQGARVELPEACPVALGDRIELELRLDEEGKVIRMQTTVAHVDGRQAGLSRQEIDLDSVTHLRRLVELNLGDPTLLHRELSALS